MKLWKNACFYTMKDEKEVVHEVLTHQGVIVATDNDIDDSMVTETIDLNQSFVFPGFSDYHMHLVGYGKNLSNLNVQKNTNKEEVLNQIMNAYQGKTLKVEGYLNIGITKLDLDKISTDNIIILRHNDYHSVTVNSVALNRLKIDHETGIMIETDGLPFEKMWAEEPEDVLKKVTNDAITSLRAYGITQIVTDDLSYYHSYIKTLKMIEQSVNQHPLRVNLLVHHHILHDYIADQYRDKLNGTYLQFDWVKVFYDGTLSSKTALLHHAYPHTTSDGYRLGKVEFTAIVLKARAAHLGIACHVIGDLGLQEVLDVLVQNPPHEGMYDRIIHASLADQHTIKRLSKMNVILDVQPLFISSDLPRVLDLFTYEPMIYPFHSYLKEGIITVGSSDAPIENPNPLLGIKIAETREIQGKVYQKEERLDRFSAIELYTKDGICKKGVKRGKIEKGYLADFTAFNEDIMHCDVDKMIESEVTFTVMDEHIIYKK